MTSAVGLLVGVMLALGGLVDASDAPEPDPWYTVEDDVAQVHLYFGWSSTCPHCRAAHPFVQDLEDKYPWLVVHFVQLNGGDARAINDLAALAESIDETLQYVPAFVYCEKMVVGYDTPEGLGAVIEADLISCQDRAQAASVTEIPSTTTTVVDKVEPISLPVIGDLDPETMSLPAFTVVIAAFDAFNPCAFFVLLFLLSVLVHARSRGRMAVIGGTFVLVSGLVYFAFMVAWLNVFLVFGALPTVTLLAGVVAITIALINIKDYFWFQRGPTLSIPEGAKPKLFSRMRALTASSSFPLILAGTVTLALAANTYELLCTAGFPMVFTRVLTLSELPALEYYAYLGLYNLIYITPLLAIVGVFVWTLGTRKLSEKGGRILKLASGLMMLGLGSVLVFVPGWLENPLTAPAVLLVALAATGAVLGFDQVRTSRGLRSKTAGA